MERIPESELMDDPAHAKAYARADMSEPHQAFVTYFSERFLMHEPKRVLDLGCGPADVAIRFAQAYPACHVTGIDGSEPMLELAESAVVKAKLSSRFDLRLGRLPSVTFEGPFDTILCNSLLHHLGDPQLLWSAVRQFGVPDAAVFVMDLLRPATRSAAEQVVAEHARGEAEVLQRDFLNSLLAAYRPDEVRQQLDVAGLTQLRIEVVSDRHLLIFGSLD